MDTAVGILFFVVVLAVVLSVSTWLHRKKVAELTEWARQWGWHYTEKRPDLVGRFSGPPFGRGRGRRAQHVLSGVHRGHQVLAFEYKYTTRSGGGNDSNSRTTRYYQVVAIPVPAPRPSLEVSREHFGHKLLELVGVHDLQLPDERFNDTFRVRTDNDRFAYDVLHPHMMEWLLADERSRHRSFRFNGDHLLTCKSGKLAAYDLHPAADYLIDVLERVPHHVWGRAPRA